MWSPSGVMMMMMLFAQFVVTISKTELLSLKSRDDAARVRKIGFVIFVTALMMSRCLLLQEACAIGICIAYQPQGYIFKTRGTNDQCLALSQA